MKATEQYSSLVLFIMQYKVFLTFESVGEMSKCEHSNECQRAVIPCAYYAIGFSAVFFSLCMRLSCHLQLTALGVPGEGVTASIRGVDDDAVTC